MAGRPQATARKVTELEGAILELYRRLDAASPAIHKQTTGKAGSSATESPWVNLYRAGCGLVVAATELGDHCRQAAGITKPGPIQESLGDDGFQRVRAWSAGRAGSSAAGDPEAIRQAATGVEGRWRSVLVYRRQHGGRTWVRLRTFNKHRIKGCWYPSPRYFVVPQECTQDLANAIEAAASGKRFSPEPDWYRDFEKQYNAGVPDSKWRARRATPATGPEG